MAYDSVPITITYHWDAVDCAAAADADCVFAGPSGMKGKVKFLQLECTETFGGTAGGAVTLGQGTSTDAANFTFQIQVSGGTAFTAGDVWAVDINNNTATEVLDVGASANSITTMTTDDIAADSTNYLTITQMAGGADTGTTDVTLVVEWRNW